MLKRFWGRNRKPLQSGGHFLGDGGERDLAFHPFPAIFPVLFAQLSLRDHWSEAFANSLAFFSGKTNPPSLLRIRLGISPEDDPITGVPAGHGLGNYAPELFLPIRLSFGRDHQQIEGAQITRGFHMWNKAQKTARSITPPSVKSCRKVSSKSPFPITTSFQLKSRKKDSAAASVRRPFGSTIRPT